MRTDNIIYKIQVMTTLSENLQAEMERQGMTQQRLAEASGVSQPAIQKILTGQTRRPRNLPELARALNITTNQLLGVEEHKPKVITDKKLERIKALLSQLSDRDIDKGIDYLETLAANATLKKFRD